MLLRAVYRCMIQYLYIIVAILNISISIIISTIRVFAEIWHDSI